MEKRAIGLSLKDAVAIIDSETKAELKWSLCVNADEEGFAAADWTQTDYGLAHFKVRSSGYPGLLVVICETWEFLMETSTYCEDTLREFVRGASRFIAFQHGAVR